MNGNKATVFHLSKWQSKVAPKKEYQIQMTATFGTQIYKKGAI